MTCFSQIPRQLFGFEVRISVFTEGLVRSIHDCFLCVLFGGGVCGHITRYSVRAKTLSSTDNFSYVWKQYIGTDELLVVIVMSLVRIVAHHWQNSNPHQAQDLASSSVNRCRYSSPGQERECNRQSGSRSTGKQLSVAVAEFVRRRRNDPLKHLVARKSFSDRFFRSGPRCESGREIPVFSDGARTHHVSRMIYFRLVMVRKS